jgi:hypothetical protein
MIMTTMVCVLNWRARKGGRDFRPAAPRPNKKIKKHKFDTPNDIKHFMRLNFSRNQPLKSADDQRNGTLKNRINLGNLR